MHEDMIDEDEEMGKDKEHMDAMYHRVVSAGTGERCVGCGESHLNIYGQENTRWAAYEMPGEDAMEKYRKRDPEEKTKPPPARGYGGSCEGCEKKIEGWPWSEKEQTLSMQNNRHYPTVRKAWDSMEAPQGDLPCESARLDSPTPGNVRLYQRKSGQKHLI